MLQAISLLSIGSYTTFPLLVFAQPNYKNIIYPIDVGSYDIEFVYNFTKYLHGIYRYNSFVLYSQPSSRFRPNFILVRDFEQALIEDFNVPIIVWGHSQTAKFRNNIGLNNLVFVQFKSIMDPILNTVDYTLEGLHFTSILFYFRNKENTKPTAFEMEEFFTWCWHRNMINVALTFQIYKITQLETGPPNVEIINKVYTYTPFPKLQVQDLSEQIEKGGGNFMIDHIENVEGFEFRTPITTTLPYVFLLQEPPNCDFSLPNCKTVMSGTTGRLFTEYIKQINGQIKIVHYPNTTYDTFEKNILLAASRNEIQIGVHPFSRLTMHTNITEGSYPIAQTNVCVIVPVITELNKAQYFQSPFGRSIWILVCLTFLTLMTLQVALQYLYAKLNKLKPTGIFGQALVSSASMLLDQAYTMKFFYKRSAIYKLFHVFMLVMTFLLSSMYSASLTSFLSSVQLGEQIDTVEQFLASGLKILISENEKRIYFKRARLPKILENSLKIVDRLTLEQHRNDLDTKYAYIVTADQWVLIDFKQQHLTKPLFRMPSAELCSETYYLKLPLQWDSPFDMSLAIFFMATQETGLSRKWQDMSIMEAKRLKLITLVKRNNEQWRPLKAKDYHTIACLMLCLWCLASFCFFGEKYCYKRKLKSRKKFNIKSMPLRLKMLQSRKNKK